MTLASLGACGWLTAPVPEGQERLTEERDMAEVVIRDLLDGHSGGTACVEVDDEDPDAAFLARFADLPFVVKADSACGWSSEELYTRVIVDLSTGEIARSVGFGDVSWDSGERATARGGWLVADLVGEILVYHLEKVRGAWRIRRKEAEGVF